MKTGPSKQRTWTGLSILAFVCGVSLLAMPWSCGAPQLSLTLYRVPNAALDLQKVGSVVKNPESLTKTDATQELLDWGNGEVRLPTFRCQDLLSPSADGDTTALGLVPSLILKGYKDDKVTLMGRVPLDVACKKLSAAILMAPPGLSEWGPLKEERADATAPGFSRVGHRVIRLPDGRYWVTGGGKGLRFDELGFPDVSDPIRTSVIYDPSTGTLSDGPELIHARAFHEAAVVGNQVFLLGGIKDRNTIAPTEGFSLPDLKSLAEGDRPEVLKDMKNRAFQTLVRIPGADGQARFVQVGGISCAPTKFDIKCEGTQLMFASVVVMPLRQTVLVIGGMKYLAGFGQWRTNSAIQEFSFAALKEDATLESAERTEPLFPPRVGHVAVRQSKTQVWIFGGVGAKDGALHIKDLVAIKDTKLLVFDDKDKKIQLKSLAHVDQGVTLTRIFARGFALDDERVWISGGLEALPATNNGKIQLASEALVVYLDPADNSKGAYLVSKLFQAPRLWHDVLALPTGQFLLSGGGQSATSFGDLFPAVAKTEIYNTTPGELVGFQPALEKVPTPDSGPPEGEPQTGDGVAPETNKETGADAGDGSGSPESAPEKAQEPATPEKKPETPPKDGGNEATPERSNTENGGEKGTE